MTQRLGGDEVVLAVVSLLSLPHVVYLISLPWRRRSRGPALRAWYEDIDGKGTPETVGEFSARLRRTKLACILVAVVGAAIAAAPLAIHAGEEDDEGGENENGYGHPWLGFAAWLDLMLQAVAMSTCWTGTWLLGLTSFFSALPMMALHLTRLLIRASSNGSDADPWSYLPAILEVCRLAVTTCFAVACLAIPRRPHLKDGRGRAVDGHWSISALNRVTFSWPWELIRIGRRKGELEIGDICRPDYGASARGLAEMWRGFGGRRPLWVCIVLNHPGSFLMQQIMAALRGLSEFLPSYCVLQLLRLIETGHRDTNEARLWAFGLFAVLVANQWTAEMFWQLIWNRISVPMRSQLTGLVFAKALRAKDIRSAAGNHNQEESADGEGAAGGKADGLEDDDATDKKNHSNIIGVDAFQVSEFAATNVNVVAFPLVTTWCVFYMLNDLLGWKSLVALAFAVVAVILINVCFLRRYSLARRDVMRARDGKMAIVSEALAGIRQIKFSAIEDRWLAKVNRARDEELTCLWRAAVADVASEMTILCLPIVLTVVAFTAYTYFEGPLRPSTAFASLAIFSSYSWTVIMLPEGVTGMVNAIVSERRLRAFLDGQDADSVQDPDSTGVRFEGASVAWPVADKSTPVADRFALRNVNVAFPEGKLTVITGRTGSGKSLMLASILGEADVLEGRVVAPKLAKGPDRPGGDVDAGPLGAEPWVLPAATAYVAQIPWIENATVTDNILFGLPMDRARFGAAVAACALGKDIDSLPDGELTEIGPNGINISGGQKWRLALARAVYSRAGILVMDDIFSAVDAHVGSHIARECLGGPLCVGRTVILVTHHVGICRPLAAHLVKLGDGGVLYSGPVDGIPSEELAALEKTRARGQHVSAGQDEGEDEHELENRIDRDSTDNGDEEEREEEEQEYAGMTKNKKPAAGSTRPSPRVFVEDEKREKHAVSSSIYLSYFRYCGGLVFIGAAVLVGIAVQGGMVGRSWWIKTWTESGSGYLSGSMSPEGGGRDDEVGYYLGIYVAICAVTMALTAAQCIYLFWSALEGSRVLFRNISTAIMGAPLRWLDTTPAGRIQNRLTSDFATMDDELGLGLNQGLTALLRLVGIFISGMIVSPILVGFAVLIGVMSWKMGGYYLAAARPCRRLSSTSLSTIMDVFNTAVDGIVTIRAFGRSAVYTGRIHDSIDDYTATLSNFFILYRWLGLRVGFIGALFSGAMAAVVVTDARVSPSVAGFGLSFAVGVSADMFSLLRYSTFVEMSMLSAERIIDYSRVEPETDAGGETPPPDWPAEGRVEFEDVTVGYAADLAPALRGLSFAVASGERVGVVGRTGAGKSSLTLALFRFLEAQSGRIVIDGIDISKIKLRELRSRLAIIPQDPVLFSGTIRSNLDPFGQHSECVLLEALERAHLATPTPSRGGGGGGGTATIHDNDHHGRDAPSSSSSLSARASSTKNPAITLSTPVAAGGRNLSAGQRQLLCLARAITARPRIVVLDEATSAVDSATDSLIQASLREGFSESTLLVVAHRLSTVADFDKILVLADGKVEEFGTPRELWDQEGAFRRLCEESGDAAQLRRVVTGAKV